MPVELSLPIVADFQAPEGVYHVSPFFIFPPSSARSAIGSIRIRSRGGVGARGRR